MLIVSLSFQLHDGGGKLPVWNTICHYLPPPACKIEAIAKADVSEDMDPRASLFILNIHIIHPSKSMEHSSFCGRIE